MGIRNGVLSDANEEHNTMTLSVNKSPQAYRGISPDRPHVVRTRRMVREKSIPVVLVCKCSKPLGEQCILNARKNGRRYRPASH